MQIFALVKLGKEVNLKRLVISASTSPFGFSAPQGPSSFVCSVWDVSTRTRSSGAQAVPGPLLERLHSCCGRDEGGCWTRPEWNELHPHCETNPRVSRGPWKESNRRASALPVGGGNLSNSGKGSWKTAWGPRGDRSPRGNVLPFVSPGKPPFGPLLGHFPLNQHLSEHFST